MTISDLLFSADVEALDDALKANPLLVSRGISLPGNPASAHPLHRICDGVFSNIYPEETGLMIAKLFLKNGANVNPEIPAGHDSPLTAACSLRCDRLALLYIQEGADIDHPGSHGGTALHWSAWCGREVILKELLKNNPDINKTCIDFKSTPLYWAIHGFKKGGKDNLHHQLECARLLIVHGADTSIPNYEGHLAIQLLEKGDIGFLELFG